MTMAGGSTPKYPGMLPPPPGITPNMQFQQSRMNLFTQIACMVATTICILLRVYTKHVTSTTYYADDCKSISTLITDDSTAIDHDDRVRRRCLGMSSKSGIAEIGSSYLMSVQAAFFIYCALCLAMGPYGFGIHMWNVTSDNLLKMFRVSLFDR
jgi:hypothetical protein